MIGANQMVPLHGGDRGGLKEAASFFYYTFTSHLSFYPPTPQGGAVLVDLY
jgi:hypothetical protein